MALWRARGRGGAREHKTAPAKQVEAPSALVFIHYWRYPRTPDERVTGDPATSFPQARQLAKAISQVAQPVDRLTRQIAVVSFQRLGGEAQPVGHIHKSCRLRAPQQCNRLG